MIRIAVDAMGGDNAPGEIVKGAVDAVSKRNDIQVLLTGQEEVVRKELEKYSVSQDRITIVPASEIIATDEPPVNAIRRKKDSSIVVGMTSIVQTMPDGSKNVIDASSNQIFGSIATTLSSIFSGNIVGLQSNFDVSFSMNGNVWTAELLPKDEAVLMILKKLTVSGTYSPTFAEMDKIVMEESSGDTIAYTFTNKNYPKELTADEKSIFTSK